MFSPRFFTQRYLPSRVSLNTKKINLQAVRLSSTKLEPDDYLRFLTPVAQNRKASFLRKMSDLMATKTPTTVQFSGGFPSPFLFPIKEANFTLYDGNTIQLTGDILDAAQQYSPTTGYPPLRKASIDFIYEYHRPPCWDSSFLSITCGSQDGFSRSIEMLMSAGDHIIVEEPSFCGAMAVMNPYNPKYIGVAGDGHGMIPDNLERALQKWRPEEVRHRKTGVPKFIYINPSGANPSGSSITHERKKRIYKLAQDYNLLILEDDPYYFLQYEDIKKCAPSFLSMDVDGRVMRFDSFSKIMASGLRVGITTGPETLVRKMVQHGEVTILHTASLSQVLINEIMKLWGPKGLQKHMLKVRKFYEQQRDDMIAAADMHLNGLCEWNVPTGGMFLWAKVIGVKDTKEMAMERGVKKELHILPGNTFMVDENAPCPYIRLSFSIGNAKDFQEGCRRLAELIREERAMHQ